MSRHSAKVSMMEDEQRDQNGRERLPKNSGPMHCNCKKSRCLKLYCECFAANRLCDGCSCKDCGNTSENSKERAHALKTAVSRDSNAFKGKMKNGTHYKGCHCKKSSCQKKYCECFAEGVKCGDLCRCLNCKNMPEGQPPREPERPPAATPAAVNPAFKALQSPMSRCSPGTMSAVNALCSFPFRPAGSEDPTSSPMPWPQAGYLAGNQPSPQVPTPLQSTVSALAQIGQQYPIQAPGTITLVTSKPDEVVPAAAPASSGLEATDNRPAPASAVLPAPLVPSDSQPLKDAEEMTAEQTGEYLHVITQELEDYRLEFERHTARLRARLANHDQDDLARQTEIDNAFFTLHSMLQQKCEYLRQKEQTESTQVRASLEAQLEQLEARIGQIAATKPAIDREAVQAQPGKEVTLQANQLVEECRAVQVPRSPLGKRSRLDMSRLASAVSGFELPDDDATASSATGGFVMPAAAHGPVPMFGGETPLGPSSLMQPSPVTEQTPDMIAQAMTPGTGDKAEPSVIDVGAMLAKAQDEGSHEAARSDSLGEFDPLADKPEDKGLSPPSPLASQIAAAKAGFDKRTVLERNASLESIGGVDLVSAQSSRQELELQGYSPGTRMVDGF